MLDHRQSKEIPLIVYGQTKNTALVNMQFSTWPKHSWDTYRRTVEIKTQNVMLQCINAIIVRSKASNCSQAIRITRIRTYSKTTSTVLVNRWYSASWPKPSRRKYSRIPLFWGEVRRNTPPPRVKNCNATLQLTKHLYSLENMVHAFQTK
jgi:hypothetical protein